MDQKGRPTTTTSRIPEWSSSSTLRLWPASWSWTTTTPSPMILNGKRGMTPNIYFVAKPEKSRGRKSDLWCAAVLLCVVWEISMNVYGWVCPWVWVCFNSIAERKDWDVESCWNLLALVRSTRMTCSWRTSRFTVWPEKNMRRKFSSENSHQKEKQRNKKTKKKHPDASLGAAVYG